MISVWPTLEVVSEVMFALGLWFVVVRLAVAVRRGEDWKTPVVGFLLRNHFKYFVGFLFLVPFASYIATVIMFSAAPGLANVSWVGLGIAWAGFLSVSLAFHYGAFDLTFEALRRRGTGAEGNPVARAMFRRLGIWGTFWVSSALIAAILGLIFIGTGFNLVAFFLTGVAAVLINFLDWVNDVIAIKSFDWFLSGKSKAGVPTWTVLPAPRPVRHRGKSGSDALKRGHPKQEESATA
jgi:hypothetical protein